MLQNHFVPAGGTTVNQRAQFFRVEAVNAAGQSEAVQIRADGQDLGRYLPGDSLTLPMEASTWEIKPDTATATAVVRIGLGRVISSRVFGNMRVIDEITDAIQTQNYGDLGVKAFTASPLVLPGLNTKGVIVRSGSVSARAGAIGNVAASALVAAKSAPTGYTTPGQRFNFLAIYENTATLQEKAQHFNKFLPPGWGLYAQTEVTGTPAAICGVQVQFEMLT